MCNENWKGHLLKRVELAASTRVLSLASYWMMKNSFRKISEVNVTYQCNSKNKDTTNNPEQHKQVIKVANNALQTMHCLLQLMLLSMKIPKIVSVSASGWWVIQHEYLVRNSSSTIDDSWGTPPVSTFQISSAITSLQFLGTSSMLLASLPSIADF